MWRTGLVSPRHVGSSRTRARTGVPCIGRWTLNHCGTREALFRSALISLSNILTSHSLNSLIEISHYAEVHGTFKFFSIFLLLVFKNTIDFSVYWLCIQCEYLLNNMAFEFNETEGTGKVC